jgi:hypothetical protein
MNRNELIALLKAKAKTKTHILIASDSEGNSFHAVVGFGLEKDEDGNDVFILYPDDEQVELSYEDLDES